MAGRLSGEAGRVVAERGGRCSVEERRCTPRLGLKSAVLPVGEVLFPTPCLSRGPGCRPRGCRQAESGSRTRFGWETPLSPSAHPIRRLRAGPFLFSVNSSLPPFLRARQRKAARKRDEGPIPSKAPGFPPAAVSPSPGLSPRPVPSRTSPPKRGPTPAWPSCPCWPPTPPAPSAWPLSPRGDWDRSAARWRFSSLAAVRRRRGGRFHVPPSSPRRFPRCWARIWDVW